MRKWIRSIYANLPVIRELRESVELLHKVDTELAGLRWTRGLVETASLIQTLEILKASNPRYREPLRLMTHGAQYWSQNYEDGIIHEIFRRIQSTTKTFLEIGVGDGAENNTTALLSRGWHGWWIEADSTSCQKIRSRLAEMPTLGKQLVLCEAIVSPVNITKLIEKLEIPSEVDLLSLDIDLDTYHIWEALTHFKPRVVVVEYNAGVPPDQAWIHPYKPDRVWDGSQAFGASLKAFEILGRKLEYSLVGCDIIGVNAFFVRNDLIQENFSAPFTAENHYEPVRYGLTRRWGHHSSLFGESNKLQ